MSPFATESGEREMLYAVRALVPDVAIVHVQRADEEGNAHCWGNFGVMLEGVGAAKKARPEQAPAPGQQQRHRWHSSLARDLDGTDDWRAAHRGAGNSAGREPPTYIDGTEPPFLIMHGDADLVVPPEQGQISTAPSAPPAYPPS